MKKLIPLLLSVMILLAACTGTHQDVTSNPDTSNPINGEVSEQLSQPSEHASSEPMLSGQNMKMSMDLEFIDEKIIVSANLIPKATQNKFSFLLNPLLAIDEISTIDGALEWTKETVERPFRPALQKITVNVTSGYVITVKYHGKLEYGWLNTIEPERKIISWYSAWYPQEFAFPNDIADEIQVRISNLSDFTVVKGEYNEANMTWTYSAKNESGPMGDCNIIAFKQGKYAVLSQEGIDIYYWDDAESAKAADLYDYCMDVLRYYNDVLYRDHEKKDDKMTIVSFSTPGAPNGAYARKQLIVYNGLGDIKDPSMKDGAAHELGHLWATGADYSWEDWLNETCAEWSALLYLLQSNHQEAFDLAIANYTKWAAEQPAIKTADGSHPGDTHSKGTVLFYSIYQEYGAETIQKLLNVFVSLDEKNTESFINEVSLKVGDDIAGIIREGILK